MRQPQADQKGPDARRRRVGRLRRTQVYVAGGDKPQPPTPGSPPPGLGGGGGGGAPPPPRKPSPQMGLFQQPARLRGETRRARYPPTLGGQRLWRAGLSKFGAASALRELLETLLTLPVA